MKLLILACLIIAQIPVLGQVLLSQGQSQVFEFRAQNPLPPEELFNTTLGLNFAQNTFFLGEDATVEIFPNALEDTPFRFNIVSLIDPTDSTSSVGGGTSDAWDASPLWPDLQCFIRITMNNGDAQLEGFSLYVTKASDFSIYHEFMPVPEPASLALIGVGAGCIALFRRRFN